MLLLIFFFKYVFIYLDAWVLVAAWGIFCCGLGSVVVVQGDLSSLTHTLTEHTFPALQGEFLTTRPPGFKYLTCQ